METTKFYIRHREGYPETMLQSYAYHGFRELGVEISTYEWIDDIETLPDLGPTIGVAGYIGDVHRALTVLGKPIPVNVDYPEVLKPYFGRQIYTTTLGLVRQRHTPVFIKPLEHKAFTGFVWNGDATSRRRVVTQPDETEVWASEVVQFRGEYRCFVLDGEILDVRRYKGDWSIAPESTLLNWAVALMQQNSAPRAYCLDWGVMSNGRTLLVEMNDGFAFGHYGLLPTYYARMLAARWHEMTS